MFDIVGRRRLYYILSAVAIIPGLIFVLLGPLTGGQAGLQFSIDFTGGTIWEVRFEREEQPLPSEVRQVMSDQGLGGTVTLTTYGERQYVLIRTEPIGLIEEPPAPEPTPTPAATPDATPTPTPAAGATPEATPEATPTPAPGATPAPTPTPEAVPPPTHHGLADLRAALEAEFGPIAEVRQEATIGPVISAELGQQAIVLIILGSLGILGWMTLRFSDFRMGTVAIVAIVHDVLIVVGIFAVLGTFMGLQVDAMFVTAMLTVIGFSVHDTIVVFDRIRENRVRHAGEPFAAIVNHSLLQTLARSVNTSVTTVVVLVALMLMGGDAIRSFLFAMVIGILAGTYSSIFNASALLVTWHEWSARRREQEFAAARSR